MFAKPARQERGIAHLIPVIVIAAIVFIALTAISYARDQKYLVGNQSVLGEKTIFDLLDY